MERSSAALQIRAAEEAMDDHSPPPAIGEGQVGELLDKLIPDTLQPILILTVWCQEIS